MDAQHIDKKRFEAFIDAVFAIVITFLVLEFKVPHIKGGDDLMLKGALSEMIPLLFCYIISFFTIMTIWLDHHQMFLFIKRIPKKYAVLNFIFLLSVSALPFATGLAGEYITSKFAVMFFLSIIFIMNILFAILFIYPIKNNLIAPEDLAKFNEGATIAKIGIVLEIISIPMVLVNTVLGMSISFLVLCLHLLKIYIRPLHR
ncbi:MAG TPA: TMEM175 family protein [Chitinophagales bacterium]|nr:TMEM175 family protein [Chitinophagales bacterium]